MNATIFIKPAGGLLVRDPQTMQPLAAEGEHKPRTSYWLRRLASGAVVEANPPKEAKKEAPDT
jgi:hypothetical protein